MPNALPSLNVASVCIASCSLNSFSTASDFCLAMMFSVIADLILRYAASTLPAFTASLSSSVRYLPYCDSRWSVIAFFSCLDLVSSLMPRTNNSRFAVSLPICSVVAFRLSLSSLLVSARCFSISVNSLVLLDRITSAPASAVATASAAPNGFEANAAVKTFCAAATSPIFPARICCATPYAVVSVVRNASCAASSLSTTNNAKRNARCLTRFAKFWTCAAFRAM